MKFFKKIFPLLMYWKLDILKTFWGKKYFISEKKNIYKNMWAWSRTCITIQATHRLPLWRPSFSDLFIEKQYFKVLMQVELFMLTYYIDKWIENTKLCIWHTIFSGNPLLKHFSYYFFIYRILHNFFNKS
jgi:hypothetical protein